MISDTCLKKEGSVGCWYFFFKVKRYLLLVGKLNRRVAFFSYFTNMLNMLNIYIYRKILVISPGLKLCKGSSVGLLGGGGDLYPGAGVL